MMREHMQTIDGVSYIQVHPTFFYESLWNVGVLILILMLIKKKKFNGEIFILYMVGYALGRVWIEGLRTDQLQIGSTGIAVCRRDCCCRGWDLGVCANSPAKEASGITTILS
jgi:phosphatidylglycerol:prolipoprotein diacylglycerol transferase